MRDFKLAPLLSGGAVALSLVFVGLEVRQNTAAARGATLQAISDAHSEFMFTVSTDPEFSDLMRRVFSGQTRVDLEPTEVFQVRSSFIAWIAMLENTYLQNRLGLVSDDVFESYGWNNAIHRTAFFEDFWTASAHLFTSPEFKDFFESRVEIGPPQ